jgi:hypothetical protein
VIGVRAPRAPSQSVRDAADALLVAEGYASLGDRWIEVDPDTAEQTWLHLLCTELSTERAVMDRGDAQRVARPLLADLPSATSLTNGTWVAGAIALGAGTRIGPFWTPVTSGDFDGGIVAVSSSTVTLLWVIDE